MQNKLDRKYYVWIWLGLIFATYIRNVYSIYADISALAATASRTEIITNVFMMIFGYGPIPAAITFLFTLILYYILIRRHSAYFSRNDFCYIIMTAVAAERIVAGIIDGFSILSFEMHVVTSTVLDVLLLPGVMLGTFFLMSKIYKFNVVEKSNCFAVLSVAFMLVLGLSVFGNNFIIVALGTNSRVSAGVVEYLRQMGYETGALTMDVQVYSSISAIVIYLAYLIADITLASIMRKNAREYQNDDTREDFVARYSQGSRYEAPQSVKDDSESVFDDFEESHTRKKDDEHVFDEFDI